MSMTYFCCFPKSCSKMVGRANSSFDSGTGRSQLSTNKIVHGFNLVKGKASHPMEDYHVAKFTRIKGHELGLYAIFDGHLGDNVPLYLQKNLFLNILSEVSNLHCNRNYGRCHWQFLCILDRTLLVLILQQNVQEEFWAHPGRAITKAYDKTDKDILAHTSDLGRGGSTAVTAIVIDGQKLLVANVGDSRAVLCRNGKAIQLSVDHEPGVERGSIENRGGFVSKIPGDVPRVNGQLAVSRAFGDTSLKSHLRSDPDVVEVDINSQTEFLILASDGLWKVMGNQEAVDFVSKIKKPRLAAKQLTTEAVNRESKDDISCIVVRFR